MKKVILMIALISTIISCTKNEKIEPVITQPRKVRMIPSNPGNNLKTAVGHSLYFYGYVDWDPSCSCWKYIIVWCECYWPAGNCAEEVVITPNSPSTIQQSADSLADCFKTSSLPEYFSNSGYKTLFPNLDNFKGVVDSVVNSQIVLNYFYNSSDSTDFYIGLPAGTTLTDTTWMNKTRFVLRIKDKR